MSKTAPPRNDVPIEHTWDPGSIFATPEAWQAAISSVTEKIESLSSLEGHVGDGAGEALRFLKARDELVNLAYRIWQYAAMFYEVETSNQDAAGMNARAQMVLSRVVSGLAFGEPELLAVSEATTQQWLADYTELAVYSHYFDELSRRRAHVRSAEVEALLGAVLEPFLTAANTHSVLSDADLKFGSAGEGPDREITQGTIDALKSDPDREVRRVAFEKYADGYLACQNTIANALASGIQQNVFFARSRRYASSLEAALAPSHIPTDVFHNLIATFRRRIPLWHRYWEVRRRALGYEKLHVYDIKAPLCRKPPTVSFKQGMDWICDGMAPLGPEYVSVMKKGVFEQRWVDIYPNQGKRMGAFSSGCQGTHPFILMSYNDDLYSLSTLAHELGHSMHSYHTWKTQPPIYADYSTFIAEVASNFNQAMVRDYLFRSQPDRDFQITLIEEAMSNFHRYFLIMPTLARFELEMHERTERGEPHTAESLNSLMLDLFKEAYGDGVVIDAERIGITWAQFPTHLYSNFYVFQYATGIAGAHALADRVMASVAGAAERYIEFLSAGSSLYPLDALARAGVDLSKPEPVEKAFDVLGEYVERLAALTA